jgi:hypothetical protein
MVSEKLRRFAPLSLLAVPLALVGLAAFGGSLPMPGMASGPAPGPSGKASTDAPPVATSAPASPQKFDAPGKGDTIKVMFMGNSLTFYNDMPKMVQAFARETKQPKQIVVFQATSPAYTFSHHWDWHRTRDWIKDEQLDFIIMQEKSTGPVDDYEKFEKFGTMLVEEIRKYQKTAQVWLFLNWSRKGHQQQDKLNTATYGLADKLKIGVVPIGKAFMASEDKPTKIPLYEKDGLHPTPHASYLEACVIYAKLYGKSPVGLPAKVVDNDGKVLVDINADEARILQQISWDAVNEKGKKK